MLSESVDLKAEKKEFNRKFLSIIMPLLVSSIFSQCLTFIDQWMVSALGSTAIAAVGVSTNFFSVYFTFLYGCNTGAGIYLTRYWVQKNIKDFQRIIWTAVTVTFTVGLVMCLAATIFPDIIIRLFNRDPLVIEKAKPYMRIVAVSYLLDAICYAVSFCFRNIGNVKIPMIQGIGSMMFNMLFNYMFIFGKLGSPKLGVTGAALGTLAARIVELIGLLRHRCCTCTCRKLGTGGRPYIYL